MTALAIGVAAAAALVNAVLYVEENNHLAVLLFAANIAAIAALVLS